MTLTLEGFVTTPILNGIRRGVGWSELRVYSTKGEEQDLDPVLVLVPRSEEVQEELKRLLVTYSEWEE